VVAAGVLVVVGSDPASYAVSKTAYIHGPKGEPDYLNS